TLDGASFLAVSPHHPLAAALAAKDPALVAFIAECDRVGTSEAAIEAGEKKGYRTALVGRHPYLPTELPVYVANFVLMEYGTGAIFGVPSGDQRDLEFARKYGLPVIETYRPLEARDPTPEERAQYASKFAEHPVVQIGNGKNRETLFAITETAFVDKSETEKVRYTAAGFMDETEIAPVEAIERAIRWIERHEAGEGTIQYRLRDWGVSRQRYWGCPIPVIYCAACGAVPVPESDLPVVLPEDVTYMGVQSPIKADPEWRRTTCPECGAAAERETDTFDTFMESSWYYARYCCPDADSQLDERVHYWLPIDQYIGGIEHAILHLMYFRFYHKLMRDAGMVQTDEPATRLLCQGMVVADTYYREDESGEVHWINPAQVEVERDSRGKPVGARLAADGEPVRFGGVEKMSKSRNNGVDPQRLVDRYGADTVRLFSVSDSPPHQSLEWSESGVEGASRFLRRVWAQVTAHVDAGPCEPLDPAMLDGEQKELRRLLHDTVAKVGDDVSRRYTFNTAIAAIMELTNHLGRVTRDDGQSRAVVREAWLAIVRMLAPITPHICEALWAELGGEGLVCRAAWPEADEAARERQQVTLVVQVNGKLRARLELQPGASRDSALEQALTVDNVQRHMEGKTVRKVIHVPDRLLNIVVG
ncbi:MAG: leucine--tRNA ligase, partial [Xanthomonadales bacterium]|nr:leucine--tRNA ligase [Xanthomonadales bacterium]